MGIALVMGGRLEAFEASRVFLRLCRRKGDYAVHMHGSFNSPFYVLLSNILLISVQLKGFQNKRRQAPSSLPEIQDPTGVGTAF